MHNFTFETSIPCNIKNKLLSTFLYTLYKCILYNFVYTLCTLSVLCRGATAKVSQHELLIKKRM